MNFYIYFHQVGREESEDRENILSRLESLENKKKELTEKINKYKDCDPQIIQKLKEESAVCNCFLFEVLFERLQCHLPEVT